MDFLTYFKGRTQKLNKKDGLTSILQSNCIPIEKAPVSNSFHQISQFYNYSDGERQSQYSNDNSVINSNPQAISNITVNKINRKLSHASPQKQHIKLYNQLKSKYNDQQLSFQLQKTKPVNLNDYQIIAIPKSVVQYGFKIKQNDQLKPELRVSNILWTREINSRSNSLDSKQNKPLNKSDIIYSRSKSNQKPRKSFIIAGLNSIL